MGGYKVVYYRDARGRLPVKEYINALEDNAAAKVFKYNESFTLPLSAKQ